MTRIPWKTRIHAAVRHPDEPAVLSREKKDHFRLPVFQAEDLWLSAMKDITPVFARKLAAPLWGLRLIYSRTNDRRRVHEGVIEFELLESNWAPPPGYSWIGLEDLESKPILPRKIEKAVRSYLGERQAQTPHPLRPPWATPGWLKTSLTPWLEEVLASHGHRLRGVLPVKQWGISCVLQVRTDGPDFFFKTTNANMPLFVNEARITRALAARYPGFVPEPLAIQETEDWMLLPAFERPLSLDTEPELRLTLYRRFAELQVRSIPETEDLLADGALDRRLPVLQKQLDVLLDDLEVLRHFDRAGRQELKAFGPVFRDLIERLAALEIPDTLVHGDLHENNAAFLAGRMVYYDWTDAGISHPFFDLQSIFWWLEEQDAEQAQTVLEAYLEPWKQVIPENRLREALPLARVVLNLHHAVSYQHIVANLEPLSKPELDFTHEILTGALKEARSILN